MKNGFFHADPLAYDIVVAPELETALGARNIAVGTHSYNGRVSNARYDDSGRIIGDVLIDGITYLARSETFLGLSYWFLFACKESERVSE